MKYLFIGAHPDDIEFSCAGTILKMIADGNEVGCVVMSNGEGSGAEDNSARKENQHEVWKHLGISYGRMLDLADGYMNADRHMVGILANIINEFEADVVFTHFPSDRHQDHRAVANAVTSACGMNRNLVYYDSYSSFGFTPDVYIDISNHAYNKKKTILLFKSEIDKYDKRGTSFDGMALARNVKYGNDISVMYAEGYKIGRYIID